MTGVQFGAPGAGGAILAAAARASLAAAGAIAVPTARLLGRVRYKSVERQAARLAWRALGTDLHVTGLEHARGGPFVVLPLHESLVDPLLLACLPLRQRFLARDELWGWPHVGRLLRSGGHLSIPLRLDAGDARAVLREAREVTRLGDSIVVFPQGSILGIEVAFNRGGFWLAQRLDVPVLPVVITGTHRLWQYPYSPRLERRHPVSLHVLGPIPGADAWERASEVEQTMRSVALGDRHASPRRFVPDRDGYWNDYPYEIAPEFPALAAQIAAHRHRIAAPFV
ncbi:MAG: lysophospholipid acyltransferase family protein, partial [Pseudonocardia sp.]